MSIRNKSCGHLGLFILVIAFGVVVAGCGESNQVAAIDTTAPAAPAGLRAAASNSAIYLRWTANTESDLGGYNIYAAMDASAMELIAVVPSTSTSYQEVRERDHEYSYEITAIDHSNNESATSNLVRIMHDGQPGGGIRDNIESLIER